MKELAKALAKAQSEMKAAKKDAENPFFKSKYADLASVWAACREPLSANGLSIIQSTDFDEDCMWIVTTLLHSSGESVSGRYPVRPVKSDPQGMGSATSYARRYALAAMVGVVTEDDDGNAASDTSRGVDEKKPSKPAPVATKTSPNAAGDAAKKFATALIHEIGTCKNANAVDDLWADRAEKLAKLKEVSPDDYAQVKAAVDGQRESFR